MSNVLIVAEQAQGHLRKATLHALTAGRELAKRTGRAEELTPVRARLMAVARTPAERALAKE